MRRRKHLTTKTRKTKQNIIRFPSSKKERRRLLLESKDIRVRIVTTLRTACGWLLVIAVFLFLLSNYRLFTPASIQSLASYAIAGLREHGGDATTIAYENGSFSDAALFESGLAYADSDSLFLAKPGGLVTLRQTLGYTAPVVEACDDYVLAFDCGGTKAVLANSVSAAAELELTSPILTGSIAENGHFALVTDEQGYRTAAAVYDTSGKEVFKYQSSEYYIVSAALSPDGNTLAALAFRQDGVMLDSHLLLYTVSSGELAADAVLEGTLGIDVRFLSNGTAAILADDGLYLADRKGGTEHVLTFVSSDLLAFSMQNGAVVLATRSYSGGARSDLYTVQEDGVLNGPFFLSEEPSAVSLSNAGFAVLTSSGVSVYDSSAAPLWHNSEAVGARSVLLTDDGTLFALYAKNTRLFTAHSEQSEDISHAS